MQAVILAGGLGTRISEESYSKPKPMVQIGNFPILWHIMKFYSYYDVQDFIICLGYKGYIIKEYFHNYFIHQSDFTIDLKSKNLTFHNKNDENWKITLVDTGENTSTGGRLMRVKDYINHETFCFTYGDGLSNINISELISFHHKNKKKSTITAVQMPGRFGTLNISSNNQVTSFIEKPDGVSSNVLINGGYFVLQKSVIDYIENDQTVWEEGPLEQLSKEGQLIAYRHKGFWKPMDTLREKNQLESLWKSNNAPWKVWS